MEATVLGESFESLFFLKIFYAPWQFVIFQNMAWKYWDHNGLLGPMYDLVDDDELTQFTTY